MSAWKIIVIGCEGLTMTIESALANVWIIYLFAYFSAE